MTEAQRQAIQELRRSGYAVTLYAPEELKGADRRDVENVMESSATEAISDLYFKASYEHAEG